MAGKVKKIDWMFLRWLNRRVHCRALDFIMPKITLLGDKGIFWMLIALILIIFKKYRYYGVLMLVGMLMGLVLGNGVMKHVVGRARPCWEDENLRLLIRNPRDYSFPSGHTLSSMISATILMFANPYFGIAAAVIAILIAFSRLYLCVHFLSDVLVASFMGILIGILTCFLLGTLVIALFDRFHLNIMERLQY